jgi:hypothetical protein
MAAIIPILKLAKLGKLAGGAGGKLKVAANVMSIIGSAATVAGFFSKKSSDRKILGKLEEIKRYLKELDSKVDQVIKQNETIIEKLDELPHIIEDIVEEVVDIALLEERYSTLKSIRNNYFLLNEEEQGRYRINTAGWDRISEALTYISDHENRLSKIIEIITWCEFALVVTEGKSIRVVKEIAFGKGSMIVPLLDELEAIMMASYSDLLNTLESAYVENHNLSETLPALEDIRYDLVDDKQEWRWAFVLDCPPGKIPNGGCVEREFKKTIVANVNFNRKKQEKPAAINARVKKLKVDIRNYCAARDAILALMSYHDMLIEDADRIAVADLPVAAVAGFEISETEPQFIPLQ